MEQAKEQTAPLSIDNANRRSAVRYQTNMRADVREAGQSSVRVTVFDLSVQGCRVVARSTFSVGTRVWLRLPTLEAWPAEVVWSEGDYAGCRFAKPMHPAVVANLTSLSTLHKAWLNPAE
jgi:hypothetical protein